MCGTGFRDGICVIMRILLKIMQIHGGIMRIQPKILRIEPLIMRTYFPCIKHERLSQNKSKIILPDRYIIPSICSQ